MYTDLIFDLYGTLVDIHTEENEAVWEHTSQFFRDHGADYTATQLRDGFDAQLQQRQAIAGQSYECFPDIPFEDILNALFREQGVEDAALGLEAAKHFRVASTEYIRLYPKVVESLAALKEKGFRLWLLSNAQRAFTDFELDDLGLSACFDGIYISSVYGFRKPDRRFFDALLREQSLDSEHCLMIGNDRETDIAGAKNANLATLYLHTNLTPPEQAPAIPFAPGRHMEYEGWDWEALTTLLCSL